jgi:hypothetical protein
MIRHASRKFLKKIQIIFLIKYFLQIIFEKFDKNNLK